MIWLEYLLCETLGLYSATPAHLFQHPVTTEPVLGNMLGTVASLIQLDKRQTCLETVALDIEKK